MTDTTKTTIEKAHGCDPVGFQNDTTKDPIIAATSEDRKTLATLRARAALAGVTLYAIENDHGKTVYIVSKWALTRQLDSLDAAENWLDLVTGVKHGL